MGIIVSLLGTVTGTIELEYFASGSRLFFSFLKNVG